MTIQSLRRRFRTAAAAHNWLEETTTVLGVAFFVLAAACIVGIAVSIASLGDPDPGFGATGGFLQATRGFGIALLAVFGVLSAGVGWFMAGEPIRRAARRLRGRG
ncbi:MAG: hypothetical protein ACRDHU_08830 [Actinomycetota bacterium]